MKKIIENAGAERRRFVKTLAGAGAVGSALGLSLASTSVMAQSASGYQVIDKPLTTGDASRVEVLEFFWFGCPHCYAFEPSINAWKDSKPDYVDFVREAPPLNPSWEQHSRTFYAAQALGITDGMFDQTFNQIHQNRKPLRDPKKIGQFIESLDLGVSGEKFRKAMESFAVESKLKRSISLARQSGINSVPSIIVNGKYRTSTTLAGGHAGIIDVINERAAFENKGV